MPPQEQQRRQARQERSREESRSESSPPPQGSLRETGAAAAAGRQRGQSDMALDEAVISVGKDGARNIRIEWIQVPLPHASPCRFAVTTAVGNALEVSMEQKSYRKSYQGASSLQTDITPVAPIGTKGKLTVHDLSTGELLEQPWTWRSQASPGLWALFKRLFT